MDYQTFKETIIEELIHYPKKLIFKTGWLADDPNKEHWKRLALEGDYPEAIYATSNHTLLSLLIGEGHGQEHYVDWARNGGFAVKSALIRHGHCLDQLVRDPEPIIGVRVVEQEPERIHQLLDVHSWYRVCRVIGCKKNPPYPMVKGFLERIPGEPMEQWYAMCVEGLRLKLKDWEKYQSEPQATLFEHTMTLAQLYETGNVTWVRNLRADRIANVLNAEQVLRGKEHVLPLFNELLATKHFDDAHMTAINRKKELAN